MTSRIIILLICLITAGSFLKLSAQDTTATTNPTPAKVNNNSPKPSLEKSDRKNRKKTKAETQPEQAPKTSVAPKAEEEKSKLAAQKQKAFQEEQRRKEAFRQKNGGFGANPQPTPTTSNTTALKPVPSQSVSVPSNATKGLTQAQIKQLEQQWRLRARAYVKTPLALRAREEGADREINNLTRKVSECEAKNLELQGELERNSRLSKENQALKDKIQQLESALETQKITSIPPPTKSQPVTGNAKYDSLLREHNRLYIAYNGLKNKVVKADAAPNEADWPGMLYRVQIGTYSKNRFKSWQPTDRNLSSENAGEQTRYLIGRFRTAEEAQNFCDEIKVMGIKDAFVVAYKDGVRVNVPNAPAPAYKPPVAPKPATPPTTPTPTPVAPPKPAAPQTNPTPADKKKPKIDNSLGPVSSPLQKKPTNKGGDDVEDNPNLQEQKTPTTPKLNDAYRLQLIFGNQTAANQAKTDLANVYPNVSIHACYLRPYYRLQIEKFPHRAAADAFADTLRARYKGVTIVSEQVPSKFDKTQTVTLR